jgi:hypothetical protein
MRRLRAAAFAICCTQWQRAGISPGRHYDAEVKNGSKMMYVGTHLCKCIPPHNPCTQGHSMRIAHVQRTLATFHKVANLSAQKRGPLPCCNLRSKCKVAIEEAAARMEARKRGGGSEKDKHLAKNLIVCLDIFHFRPAFKAPILQHEYVIREFAHLLFCC